MIVLNAFEKLQLKSQYELGRWKILNCAVTLYASKKLLIQGSGAEQVKELILSKLKLDDFLILGIDETGRGENFGILVVVGILGCSKDFLELRDSKKIQKIEEKKKIVEQKAKHIFVRIFSPGEIDSLRLQGINLNQMEAQAMDSIIQEAQKTNLDFKIKIDGNPLPLKSKNVEFIVKGDDLEPVIGAASVLAKFVRDTSLNNEKRKTWKSKL